MKDLVTVEPRNGYAIVRLGRPEKKNAMNRQARRELLAAFHTSRVGCKAVVLTGSGDSFCAGVDLKEARADADAGTPPDPRSDWIEVLLAIREHPAIFVAAVNGFALGGGATLISMCDLAIAAEDAEIGMPEIGFGAYPQFSGPAAQIQLTPKRAAWLVLTAERIDGRTAEAWGIVNRSVARDRLMAEAELLADKLSRFDAVALAESKHALDIARGRSPAGGRPSPTGWPSTPGSGRRAAHSGRDSRALRRANAISDKEERAGCRFEPIQDRLDSGRA
jgi:enoyl-CoA hydratase/carnithine racemase